MYGDHLAELFEAELACLRQLHGSLRREYEALLAADSAAIELATQAKTQVLSSQADLTRRRQEYLGQAGFEATSHGLDCLIRSCDNTGQLLDMLSELSALGQQCHHANRVNGRLIAQKQQQTLGALNILRRADQSPATYSGAGGAVDSGSNRLLGKA